MKGTIGAAQGFAEALDKLKERKGTSENALIFAAILNLTRAFSAPIFSPTQF